MRAGPSVGLPAFEAFGDLIQIADGRAWVAWGTGGADPLAIFPGGSKYGKRSGIDNGLFRLVRRFGQIGHGTRQQFGGLAQSAADVHGIEQRHLAPGGLHPEGYDRMFPQPGGQLVLLQVMGLPQGADQ